MHKKINDKKLEKLFQTTVNKKKEISLKEKNLVYENLIYFDGRQYSLKIPRRIFDFINYKKGDKLRFIIDDTEQNNPKLSINYEKG